MTQEEALGIMKMGYNVYLTGEAGAGKTFVLAKYIKFLKEKHIPVAVTASTGIAATHIEGVTIDSWSGLGIKDEIGSQDLAELSGKFLLKRRVRKAQVLVIDEISMISGHRLTLYDKILRHLKKSDLPFGGLQVILSGDLFQLPPVSRDGRKINFVFQSDAWRELDLRICYLMESKRHRDKDLVRILNDIRHNRVSQDTVNLLINTSRHGLPVPYTPTKLYTHNVDVDALNQRELEKISGQSHFYYMSFVGPEKLVEAMKRTCLSPEKLELKKGALVMFVKNNFEQGYVNGTLGKIIGFDRHDEPVVKTLAGNKITVRSASWTVTEGEKIIAQITQIPLRLAWAITVHKSQGMTLDAAEIDLSRSFVEGMGYVALSRVKSLSGLRLLGINDMAFRVNPDISRIDKYLLQLSEGTAINLHKLGPVGRWMRRFKYTYKLTSNISR